MKRERLLTHLVRLRELHLKSQSAQLKTRARHLSEVRLRREQARGAAANSLNDAGGLADLAHFGQVRLREAKLATAVASEVASLSEKVGHARKLTDSARAAHAQIHRERNTERERAMESEAEHFFGWQSGARS